MSGTSISRERPASLRVAPPVPRSGQPSSLPTAKAPVVQDHFVSSGKGAESSPPAGSRPSIPGPVVQPTPPLPTLKERIQENRQRYALVVQAQKMASADPAAGAAWQQAAASYLEWLKSLEGKPTAPATSDDMLEFWMGMAAEQVVAARALGTPSARLAAYEQYFAEFHAKPNKASRALLAAATKGVLPKSPLPLTAASREIQAQLAPAVSVLSASNSPVAQELARKIRQGEISLQMVDGQMMGTLFYAVVNRSRIKLSNGDKGPNFFQLSPAFQAATLLHEYTHVKQKQHIGGFLSGMGGNLAQRSLSLTGMLPGVDGERLATTGMGLNGSEQEAYRAQKAFLVEMGMGQKGVTSEDAGSLEGINYWLEAAR